jgi:hypothetical protein
MYHTEHKELGVLVSSNPSFVFSSFVFFVTVVIQSPRPLRLSVSQLSDVYSE